MLGQLIFIDEIYMAISARSHSFCFIFDWFQFTHGHGEFVRKTFKFGCKFIGFISKLGHDLIGWFSNVEWVWTIPKLLTACYSVAFLKLDVWYSYAKIMRILLHGIAWCLLKWNKQFALLTAFILMWWKSTRYYPVASLKYKILPNDCRK